MPTATADGSRGICTCDGNFKTTLQRRYRFIFSSSAAMVRDEDARVRVLMKYDNNVFTLCRRTIKHNGRTRTCASTVHCFMIIFFFFLMPEREYNVTVSRESTRERNATRMLRNRKCDNTSEGFAEQCVGKVRSSSGAFLRDDALPRYCCSCTRGVVRINVVRLRRYWPAIKCFVSVFVRIGPNARARRAK